MEGKEFLESNNNNIEKIKSKYQKQKAIEILKILLNYGITAVSGVSCVAMLYAVCNNDFDSMLSDEISKFVNAMLISGALATGMFSLEFPYVTQEKRKERYNNIKEISEEQKNLYTSLVCNESDEITSSIKRG